MCRSNLYETDVTLISYTYDASNQNMNENSPRKNMLVSFDYFLISNC